MTTILAFILAGVLAVGWLTTARLAACWWRRLHTDPLTGLGNRDALARAFTRARRRHSAIAVVLIDLDYFKEINDLWGHHTGNTVLRHVARQLARTCRELGRALPVRLHGDDFAVLLTDLPLGAAGVRLAEERAHQLAVEIGRPVTVGVDQLAVTGSVGVAVCPAEHADPSALLRAADQRMYVAKHAARHGAQVRGWSA